MNKYDRNDPIFDEIIESLIKLASGKDITTFLFALLIFQVSLIEHVFAKETIPTNVKHSVINFYYKFYTTIKKILTKEPTLQ